MSTTTHTPGRALSTARRLAAMATPAGLPFARDGLRHVLAGLFGRGGPPFRPDAAPGDPGLCGPGSSSWRIIAEPAAIAGGLRALLVQLMHPLAMAGVADHSAYRSDPLGRLSRTSAYVTVSTFGSTPEALRVARAVRAAHRRVRGHAPDGRAYDASDPHLLTWVAVALSSSFLRADRLWAPFPVEPAGRDRFVAEQSRIAALLDPRVDLVALADDPGAQAALRSGHLDPELPMLAEERLPVTEAQLDATLAELHGELAVGEQSLDAMRFLRRPPLPASARWGYRSLFSGALGSLAPDERELLGVRMGTLAARTAVRQSGVLLTGMRLAAGPSPAVELATARAEARPA